MNTKALNKVYSLQLSLKDIVNLIRGFSIEDKILIEKELEKETLDFRTKAIDKNIKPNKLKMNEIIEETRQVRKTSVY